MHWAVHATTSQPEQLQRPLCASTACQHRATTRTPSELWAHMTYWHIIRQVWPCWVPSIETAAAVILMFFR